MSTGYPRVQWLEDEPVPEWEPVALDRWTNVPGVVYPFDLFLPSVWGYDPSESPLISMIVGRSSYTSVTRAPLPWWRRPAGWGRRRAVAAARWVLERWAPWELDDGPQW